MFRLFRRVCGNVARIQQQQGILTTVLWMLDRLASRLLNFQAIEVVWLDAASLGASLETEPEFTFRFLDATEVRQFAREPENELDTLLADRVQAGSDLCFAALSGSRLAAYGWYALESIEAEHNFGAAMSFPADVAYMYKGFTPSDFRGRRLHGLIMGLALRALIDRGVTKLVSTVEWSNWASLRSCDRIGYRRLGKFVSFGFGRMRFAFQPEEAGRLGVEFGAHTRSPNATPAQVEISETELVVATC